MRAGLLSYARQLGDEWEGSKCETGAAIISFCASAEARADSRRPGARRGARLGLDLQRLFLHRRDRPEHVPVRDSRTNGERRRSDAVRRDGPEAGRSVAALPHDQRRARPLSDEYRRAGGFLRHHAQRWLVRRLHDQRERRADLVRAS